MIPASCGPAVHPVTLAAVVQVESGGDALALNVNGLGHKPPRPASVAEAAAEARHFIALGYSVDLGLMQINSRNLASLGYTVEQALDPCANIRGGAQILASDYAAASARMGAGQPALAAALSAYNTGSFERGFANGYVARYYHVAPSTPHPVVVAHGDLPHIMLTASAQKDDPFSADTGVFQRPGIRFGP